MVDRIALTAIGLQEQSCELRNGDPLRYPQTVWMDIDWIREGLKRPGKTQKGLAEALNLDPAQVTRILKNGRRLRADEIEKVRDYLGMPEPTLRSSIPTALSFGDLPRDVPVRGSASCGTDGAFDFNEGPIDWVRRPPRFRGLMDGYALYVAGDSMSPWRRNGDLVYVNPNAPPRPEDYVVVQLAPSSAGTAPQAYIKQLQRRTATELRLIQFNPIKELALPMKRVAAIHRIVDWTELMGV